MAANDDVRWTAKAPLLVAGLMLVVSGVVALHSRWKYATIGGVFLVLAGSGFVTYSMTIKEWCAARNVAQSAFAGGFGGSFHQCLRQKGWLEF